MSYPHAIRLAGPWDYEVVRTDSAEPALSKAGRVKLPADWGDSLGPRFRGEVRYVRRFNWPSGVDPYERVWLVCEGVDALGLACLNGDPLGEIRGFASASEWDVTDRLNPHNELVITAACPTSASPVAAPRPGREHLPGGIVRDVRLEVRLAVKL